MTLKIDHVNEAARAHSNLNTFGAVVSILEGGHVYGGTNKTADLIIKLCHAEMQRQLRAYDKHVKAAQASQQHPHVAAAIRVAQRAARGKNAAAYATAVADLGRTVLEKHKPR